MNKIFPILILLLLLTQLSFSQSSFGSYTINYLQSYDNVMTGQPRTIEVFYYRHDLTKFPECWGKIQVTNLTTFATYNTSRWVLFDPHMIKTVNLATPTIATELGPFNLIKFSFQDIVPIRIFLEKGIGLLNTYNYFTFVFDDSTSFKQINTLCPHNENLMVTWYGGVNDWDIYNKTINPSQYSSDGPEGVLSVRSRLDTTQYGINYQCFNVSNTDKYNATFNIENIGLRNESYLYSRIILVCGEIKLVNNLNLSSPPPEIIDIEQTSIPFKVVLTDFMTNALLSTDMSLKIYAGFTNILKDWNNFLTQDLPEPIPTLIKGINELVNLGIALIAFFVMFNVYKYFFSFRKALKTSLIKAGIIVSQLFFWYVVLLVLLYSVSHTITLCTIKGGIVIVSLNIMGINLKAPSQIWDVGAYAWDLLYLGTVTTAVSDCTAFWHKTSPDIVQSSGQMYTDYMNLGDTSISILLRATVVLMLISSIVMVIAVLWEMINHLFRRVKKMEDDVRGGPEEGNEEEDEYT
jgi:hypothetical protein